jgi:hypothetical protein
MVVLNALKYTSRRGKTAGYTLTPREGSDLRLASGFVPELAKGSMVEKEVGGRRILSITARNADEARKLIAGAKKKYGENLDLNTAELRREYRYVKEPLELSKRSMARTSGIAHGAIPTSDILLFRTGIWRGLGMCRTIRTS